MFPVFIVQMFFSVFAYIWLLIILELISPRRVEVWEAGATLGFIPVLVIASFIAEKGLCNNICTHDQEDEKKIVEDMKGVSITKNDFFKGSQNIRSPNFLKFSLDNKITNENMREFFKEMRKTGVTEEEAAKVAAAKIADSKPKSRMFYKIGASREMAGGKKVDPRKNMSERLKVSFMNLVCEKKEI